MQNKTQYVWMIRLSILISMLVIAPEMLLAVEFDAGKLTLNMHGFLSQGYLKSDANNFLAETKDGTFEFREYGLNVSAVLKKGKEGWKFQTLHFSNLTDGGAPPPEGAAPAAPPAEAPKKAQ